MLDDEVRINITLYLPRDILQICETEADFLGLSRSGYFSKVVHGAINMNKPKRKTVVENDVWKSKKTITMT